MKVVALKTSDSAHKVLSQPASKKIGFFEKYLTVWVLLCMILGVLLGRIAPGMTNMLRGAELGSGSQINLPITILIWLMIYPMMLKIEFSSLKGVGKKPKGLFITLFVNWMVKPFSMALIAWIFFKILFHDMIGESLANQYIAGAIILAAAPCTAMVFVWSYLTDGDPAYTLVQVSVNDLLMLVLFAPDRFSSRERSKQSYGTIPSAPVQCRCFYRDSSCAWCSLTNNLDSKKR